MFIRQIQVLLFDSSFARLKETKTMIDETYNDTITIEITLNTGQKIRTRINRELYLYMRETIGKKATHLYLIGMSMYTNTIVTDIYVEDEE